MEECMKYGLDVPTTGEYADPRVLAALAAEAEAAGWDGFFIWDVLGNEHPVADPWVALAAIVLRTTRIRIGTMVTPLARHRPWLVARQLANLDHLSGGRVTCTVGLGYDGRDFSAFGEADDASTRASKLDEALDIIDGLWGQDSLSYKGEHFQIEQASVLPRPVQTPRVPLWVAGGWPRRAPFRRAARWDGACIKSVHADERRWLRVDETAACVAFVREQAPREPFDIIMSGELPEDAAEARGKMDALAQVGVTWWCEEGLGWSLAEFRERIQQCKPA
jgi:alkanesulfonate monooxygenase SsuD/methylene tetrahydromethanopterin reductase-like flavin-dependent oxidoreductase (luciferase family)